jgi:hypothetical protein
MPGSSLMGKGGQVKQDIHRPAFFVFYNVSIRKKRAATPESLDFRRLRLFVQPFRDTSG